jgi:hypothetical protein
MKTKSLIILIFILFGMINNEAYAQQTGRVLQFIFTNTDRPYYGCAIEITVNAEYTIVKNGNLTNHAMNETMIVNPEQTKSCGPIYKLSSPDHFILNSATIQITSGVNSHTFNYDDGADFISGGNCITSENYAGLFFNPISNTNLRFSYEVANYLIVNNKKIN